MINFKKLIFSASLLLFSSSILATTLMNTESLVPSGKGWGVPSSKSPAVSLVGNGIDFHNGEVMGTTDQTIPKLYVIYYGNWNATGGQNLVENFLKNIGSHPWYGINNTYTDKLNRKIVKKATFVKSINDNYSQGTVLQGNNAITTIVSRAIDQGQFPLDANAIYFVLTSPDVKDNTGFCSQYCGWHMAGVYQNRAYIRVVFVGNASKQCPGGCMQAKSPNNNPGVDGLVSIVAHELTESVTDPLGNAWYDKNGQENADKCNFNFGKTTTLPNGSRYNQTIGSYRYLIQQNWVNANGGYCAQVY